MTDRPDDLDSADRPAPPPLQPPLDLPVRTAARRRLGEDADQAAWDGCRDPAAMLAGIVRSRPYAPARPRAFGEALRRACAIRLGGFERVAALRLDGGPIERAALALARADAPAALAALAHACRPLGDSAAPDLLAAAIRSCHPAAPDGWPASDRPAEGG